MNRRPAPLRAGPPSRLRGAGRSAPPGGGRRQCRARAGPRPPGVAVAAARGQRAARGPGKAPAGVGERARHGGSSASAAAEGQVHAHGRVNTRSSAGSGFSLPLPRPEGLRGKGGSLCVLCGRALVGGGSALSAACPALPVPFAHAVTSAEGSCGSGQGTVFVVVVLLFLLSRPRWERFQAAARREPRKPPRHPGPPVPRIGERGGTPAPFLSPDPLQPPLRGLPGRREQK